MITIFSDQDIVMFNFTSDKAELDFCAQFTEIRKTKSGKKLNIRNTSRGTVTIDPSKCSIFYENRRYNHEDGYQVEKLIKEVVK